MDTDHDIDRSEHQKSSDFPTSLSAGGYWRVDHNSVLCGLQSQYTLTTSRASLERLYLFVFTYVSIEKFGSKFGRHAQG